MRRDESGSMFRKALNLALWYQLLAHGLYGKFLRFYWLLLGLSAVLLAGSLWMLAEGTVGRTNFGPFWLWGLICLATVAVAYLIQRMVGIVPVALVSIILPATIIISPMVVRTTNGPAEADDMTDEPASLATGDLYCFGKGAVVFGSLVGVAAGAYTACRRWQEWRCLKHRPPRHPAAAALLAAGAASLGLLYIAIHTGPASHSFWQHGVSRFFGEPAWPYALCLWLWVAIAGILGMYDSRILPYLLHRVGQTWAPPRMTLQDAFLTDQLLAALSRSPGKAGSDRPRRGPKGG